MQASDSLFYIYQTMVDIDQAMAQGTAEPGADVSNSNINSKKKAAQGAQPSLGEQLAKDFLAALCDDLNTPAALSAMWPPMAEANRLINTAKVLPHLPFAGSKLILLSQRCLVGNTDGRNKVYSGQCRRYSIIGHAWLMPSH